MEALIRWEHPGLGSIAPGRFIHTMEETGLIIPIGLWVLEETCRQVQKWQTERECPKMCVNGASVHWSRLPFTHFVVHSQLKRTNDIRLELSVNLSAQQLQQTDLVREIAAILQQTGLAPSSLKLEITESVAMNNAEGTLAKLYELRESGIKLAIDDFGTGYSSLSYLKRFPVDTLKIDRSFVAGLGQSAEDTAIVQAVVTMAHSVGLTVTAEGVETTDTTTQLQGLGCDLAQGYYFAKPMPSHSIEALLNKGTIP